MDHRVIVTTHTNVPSTDSIRKNLDLFMKEVFTLRWIRKRNRSIGRKREDRWEIYVTFNTFNSSYFPHLLSSSLHIRKKWIDSLDDSLENRGEKREGRGKERKNYASIRENIVSSFHRGFFRRFKSRPAAGDWFRVVTLGDWRRGASGAGRRASRPTYIDARATNPGRRLNPGPLLLAPARATLFLPSFHRIVRRPSIIPLSAIPDNAFR